MPFTGDPWNEVINVVGEWSDTYKNADWSTLGNGKDLAEKDDGLISWTTDTSVSQVTQSGGTRTKDDFADQGHPGVTSLKMSGGSGDIWQFNGCDKVVIDGLDFYIEDDTDYSDIIKCINCEEVYIQNCGFWGYVSSNMIDITGAEYVLIDRCHFGPVNYSGSWKIGEVIACRGGESKSDSDWGVGPYGNDPVFTVIQNNYVDTNDGGLANTGASDTTCCEVVSTANTLFFNNYCKELYPAFRSFCEIGHRRADSYYVSAGFVARCERNII